MATVLIPGRLESTRFPGKAIAPVNGIPLIIRCAINAIQAGLDTVICTDNDLIVDIARKYKIESILTPNFSTGTDRVCWAAKQLGLKEVINLQGDEPLVSSRALKLFAERTSSMIQSLDNQVITNGLSKLDVKYAFDPNNVKAAVAADERILYLTRKPLRNSNGEDEVIDIYIKQIGLYGFHIDALERFSSLKQSKLEKAESIEMLRWIENSNLLNGILLDTPSISVDTPEDLNQVEEYMSDHNIK